MITLSDLTKLNACHGGIERFKKAKIVAVTTERYLILSYPDGEAVDDASWWAHITRYTGEVEICLGHEHCTLLFLDGKNVQYNDHLGSFESKYAYDERGRERRFVDSDGHDDRWEYDDTGLIEVKYAYNGTVTKHRTWTRRQEDEKLITVETNQLNGYWKRTVSVGRNILTITDRMGRAVGGSDEIFNV